MKRKKSSSNDALNDSWPAFTDLLGAFVLVIFLTMVFFLVNFRKAESTVHAYGLELKVKEAKLRAIQAEIKRKRERLAEERRANRKLLEDLKQTEGRLRKTLGAKKILEQMFAKLKKERMEIEKARQKAEKALAEALRSQRKAERERQICQRQVEEYVGVRRRIIQRIFTSLKKEATDPEQIKFDTKGGAIVLGANVLFKAGRWQLQKQGKKNILLAWTKVNEVIKHPLNRPYIAGVIVEGYTSSEGSSSYNWRLSTQRAYSALRFLQKHGADYWSKRGLLAAAGYGDTRPILNPDGTENRKASRRIELRILFKDREKLEELMRQFKKQKEEDQKAQPPASR